MSGERLPWGKFVWAHWENDEALALCSMGAQGLWMRLLCIAVKEGGYVLIGGKAPTVEKLARIVRATPEDVQRWLDELAEEGVFSKTRAGVIYCRRIVRELKAKDEARDTGKLGGNPKLMGDYNEPGFLYLMGVRADGAYKLGISKNPTNRLKKIRAQYPADDIRVLDRTPVADMGVAERDLHAQFAEKKSGEWFLLTDAEVGKVRGIFRTLEGSNKGSNAGPPTGPSKADKIREESESSEPNGSGATAPPADPKKQAWELGLKLLTARGGYSESRARPTVGKWAKDHPPERILQATQAAWDVGTLDPVSYVEAALRRIAGEEADPMLSPEDWRQRKWMEEFVEGQFQWNPTRGPPPGQPGCRVTAHLQREFGVEPAKPESRRIA